MGANRKLLIWDSLLWWIFLTTFIQILSINVKIQKNIKADDNRMPTTGLSGTVLSQGGEG